MTTLGSGTLQVYEDGKPIGEPMQIGSLTIEPHKPDTEAEPDPCSFVLTVDHVAHVGAALDVARLRRSRHDVVLVAGSGMPKTTRSDVDAMIAALRTRDVSLRVAERGPPPFLGSTGKQKAQWKTERSKR